ncbi:hypothetical protein PSPO01_00606 [Paraphaeosphaeria sporulosa]
MVLILQDPFLPAEAKQSATIATAGIVENTGRATWLGIAAKSMAAWSKATLARSPFVVRYSNGRMRV